MRLKIAPSLMSADLLNIGKELEVLNDYADYYHVDIIDWHYVKNMCLTPQIIAAMRTATNLPIEAHLYVDNVDEILVNTCLEAGANIITMPADIVGRSIHRYATIIHGKLAKVGIFLNPSQQISEIRPYARLLDNLIILSVDPGFGGQLFIPETYERIKEAVELRKELGAHFQISIDGNCGADRFYNLAKAGAEALALGRGLFNCAPTTKECALLTLKNIEEIEARLNSERF